MKEKGNIRPGSYDRFSRPLSSQTYIRNDNFKSTNFYSKHNYLCRYILDCLDVYIFFPHELVDIWNKRTFPDWYNSW